MTTPAAPALMTAEEFLRYPDGEGYALGTSAPAGPVIGPPGVSEGLRLGP